MKKIILLLIVFVNLFSLVACNSTDTGSNIPTNKVELEELVEPNFYTNKFDEEKIPSQWSAYGVGDPFVYRFNGRYYLYCSTKNFEMGVRGWVSDDLIHYEPITGEVYLMDM